MFEFPFSLFLLVSIGCCFLVNHGQCTKTLEISWTPQYNHKDFKPLDTNPRFSCLPIVAKNLGTTVEGSVWNLFAKVGSDKWTDSTIWHDTKQAAIIIKLNKLKLIDDKSIRFQFEW